MYKIVIHNFKPMHFGYFSMNSYKLPPPKLQSMEPVNCINIGGNVQLPSGTMYSQLVILCSSHTKKMQQVCSQLSKDLLSTSCCKPGQCILILACCDDLLQDNNRHAASCTFLAVNFITLPTITSKNNETFLVLNIFFIWRSLYPYNSIFDD